MVFSAYNASFYAQEHVAISPILPPPSLSEGKKKHVKDIFFHFYS